MDPKPRAGLRAGTVVEIGLAYGSSALAIGEALVTAGAPDPTHVIIDPWRSRNWSPRGSSPVATALRYYERNLGWTAIPNAFPDGSRGRAVRLPDPAFEPRFEDFQPF